MPSLDTSIDPQHVISSRISIAACLTSSRALRECHRMVMWQLENAGAEQNALGRSRDEPNALKRIHDLEAIKCLPALFTPNAGHPTLCEPCRLAEATRSRPTAWPSNLPG